jgi:ABC-type multidrug transport system ATPase subunit
LILDEPTLGQDITNQQFLFDSLLVNNYFADKTVLYCTHRLEELARIADSVVAINNGKLVAHGDVVHYTYLVNTWRVCFAPGIDISDKVPKLLTTRVLDQTFYYNVEAAAGDLSAFFTRHGALDVEKVRPDFATSVSALINPQSKVDPFYHRGGWLL